MNYEIELCRAIDLLALEDLSASDTLLEALIQNIKSDLKSTPAKASELHFYWAQVLEIQEEPELALLQYEKSLKANPDELRSWEALCRLLLEDMDRPEEALRILNARLIPSDPDSACYQDWMDKAELALNHHSFTRSEKPVLGQED